ncbi:hypothetical protein DIPPA_23440 [Diplonema papillatum]|nr:hypothetical protein DIPPA_23440 [Diplonema papillatum]
MLEDPTFEAHFAPSERYGSWEFYVEAMRGPYEYGDEMTLTAAATVTGTTIWVLDSRSPPRVGMKRSDSKQFKNALGPKKMTRG